MSPFELQIPPKSLLELFDAESVSTGMTCAAPGGVNLTVGGHENRANTDVLLVPIHVTVRAGVSIDLFSNWLAYKLNQASVRHIRINGVEIEVTAEEIAKAISEYIETDRVAIGRGEELSGESLIHPSLSAATLSEEEIIESKQEIVCLRVPPDVELEQYVQGSVVKKCSSCQWDVLVAPSTNMILAHGENQIICTQCWTEANPAEPLADDRQSKLRQLADCKQAGENAYDDLYEKAHHPSEAAAFFSNAKESFYTAITLARELGLEQEVESLEKRLAHIKAVFRSQFS